MRVAVLGRTHWLLASAKTIALQGHAIALVATAQPAPEYRAQEGDFEALAQAHEAPFFASPDVNGADFINTLRAAKADVAISVNWPTLIRREACESIPHGILNAHAGDLPRYRGNACPNWAILNGEPHVGLCVHAMDPDALDAGPVYARDRLELGSEVYITDIYTWLDTAVPDLFAKAIANLAAPEFVPEDQSAVGVRPLRTHPRRPDDGLIDWRCSAGAITRLVRASSHPFAGAFTYLEGRDRVVIWRAGIAEIDHDVAAVPGQILGRSAGGRPLVACGTGVVEIEEGTCASGRPLPASNRYRLMKEGGSA